jgi:hypothetical protein
MNRVFTLGGLVASVILIAFGIGSIVIGMTGRADVQDQIEQEQITGSPDMSPDGIRPGIEEADLDVAVPSCDVADEPIDNGSEAKCFAEYLRIHALESTGGQVYAEMGRFLDEEGNATNDEAQAATNPDTGRPVENQLRNLWVTATALSTAMNTAYFAQQVGLFAIVMGVALLLTGIGFLVLTLGLRRAAASRREAI